MLDGRILLVANSQHHFDRQPRKAGTLQLRGFVGRDLGISRCGVPHEPATGLVLFRAPTESYKEEVNEILNVQI